MRMNSVMAILVCLACVTQGFCATSTNIDLSKLFGAHQGCFVLYDEQADRYVRYQVPECAARYGRGQTVESSAIHVDLVGCWRKTAVMTGSTRANPKRPKSNLHKWMSRVKGVKPEWHLVNT
jgi:beta-lactamase class D